MLIAATAFFVALTVSLLATPVIIHVAHIVGLVDKPNNRKVHREPVPRIGGIAIAVGLGVSTIGTFLLSPASSVGFGTNPHSLQALACVGTMIFAAGLADDLWNLSSRLKLIGLIAGAAILCHYGVAVGSLEVGDNFLIRLGWTSWPLTLLWIVGIAVAINFIDGLDGLAAGIGGITCGLLGVMAAMRGDIAVVILSVALMGSLCGFLVFNFNPARIFMGDSGSLLLGTMLGALSAGSAARSGRFADLALPALAMGVPLMDALCTMLRRAVLQRRSIFSAERGHIHHRLMDRGLNHRSTVLLIYAVTLTCALLGLLTLRMGSLGGKITSAISLGVLVTLFHRSGSVPIRKTRDAIVRNLRRKKAQRRDTHIFEEVQLTLQHVTTLQSWWDEMAHAALLLGFSHLCLPMKRRDGTDYVLEWTKQQQPTDPHETMRTTVPLPQRRAGCELRVEVGVLVDGSLEVAGRRLTLLHRLLEEFSLEELGRREASLPAKPDRPKWRRGPQTAGRPRLVDENADPATEHDRLQPAPKPKRRIAVVHDFLYCYAGAERVLEQILKVYPDADVFSLFDFLPDDLRGFIQNKKVHTSFIQRLPFARKKHRGYLPLMPLAIEQLNVSAYDVIISSSYVAAKGVITRPDQLHICYCHTPIRFAWDMQNQYLAQSGLTSGIKAWVARIILHYIRNWDVRSANGVDVFLTNSNYVCRRIRKIYRRPATTVYPPVDVERFSSGKPREDFYLTVSRMVPYKRINLVADAFTRLGDRKLVIIGEGPQMAAIKALAGPNIQIMGYQPAEIVHDYMQRARAFVFAAEEDFGIVPVEAQACGTPVICFGRGGATETVVEGVTGMFFESQTVESLIEAILDFEAVDVWDHMAIRKSAERFSVGRFRRQFSAIVESEWLNFCRNRAAASMLSAVDAPPEGLRPRSAPNALPQGDLEYETEPSQLLA